jgi:Xaa-Pro dipeptidase
VTPVAPPRGFPKREYQARLERAQRHMGAAGIDALLLTNEAEVRYFSGFHTPLWLSPTRPWFLVVPAAGRPIAVIPEIGAPLMHRTWLDDVRSWPAPRPEDDGVSLLADTLRDVRAATGRIGVLTGPETALRMPLDDYRRLLGLLPQAEVVDATSLVRALRMVKSEAELAKIGYICELASIAFDGVPALASVDRTLDRTFTAFKIALLQAGADDVPYLAGAAGPGGYGDVISPPDGRRLRRGDVVVLDAGAVYDGYFCDFDRNFAVGGAEDAARRAYDTLHRATQAGLDAARPGATCAEVHRAMRDVVVADGYACEAGERMGHGLGMQLTEWPSIRAGDRTVLSAGMALTLEPALAMAPGRCMVHEEVIVVRGGGARLLSRRAPRALPGA